jgi:serine/threonine-protein kinase
VTTIRGERARAEHYELPARAAVAREDDDLLHAWLLNNLGIMAAEQGDLERAQERFEQALALKQAALGPDHIDVAIAWQNLGALLTDVGDHRGAVDALARARTTFMNTVGETHPWNIQLLLNSCRCERDLGHASEALALCERALARLASYSHPSLESRTRYTLAEILFELRRLAEARAMARRAIELGERENPALAAQWKQWLVVNEAPPENPP